MLWGKPKWSKIPGCFERHLQRRDGNILFPPEKRTISKGDIEEAQKRDKVDQDKFVNKIKDLGIELGKSGNTSSASIQQTSSVLQEVQALIEEAASIGGDIQNQIQALENAEEQLIQILNQAMPEGSHLLEKTKSLSTTARIPFIAQLKRRNTPILENEEVAALLSEDLATVSLIGYVSRSFPDFKPSEADIIRQLDYAVRQGFSKEHAQEIMTAWNEIQ